MWGVNARRTPKRILSAHPPDQCLQIGIDPWSTSEAARFPPPIATKPSAMPAHDGRRPDDRDGLEDRRKPAIQLDEEQAVAVRELYAAAYLALQHGQLMPQRGILRCKSALGLERRGNQVQKEEYQRDHRRQREAILSPDQYGRGFR